MTCDKIQRFAASESEAELMTVPCKLNNVKTNLNTLDKLMDLFKSSCIRANKNSQRKFLSNFAKTDYSKT